MEKKDHFLLIGHWYIQIGIVPSYDRESALRIIFGIFKVTSRPGEGEHFTRKNYKGFWLRKEINLNINLFYKKCIK